MFDLGVMVPSYVLILTCTWSVSLCADAMTKYSCSGRLMSSLILAPPIGFLLCSNTIYPPMVLSFTPNKANQSGPCLLDWVLSIVVSKGISFHRVLKFLSEATTSCHLRFLPFAATACRFLVVVILSFALLRANLR